MKKLIAILFIFTSAAFAGPKPRRVPGIGNFAQVTPRLYRGNQPNARGFEYLRSLHVTYDIDVRSPRRQAQHEKALCRRNGIHFVHLYWRARPWFFGPNKQDAARFITMFKAHPHDVFFVHCRQGSDRTGVLIAVERIKCQKWTAKHAAAEMSEYGYHWYLFPLWRRWVKSLR